jgi:[glutamine synthetase] adenylyltransferase / [glutamine synthetase]-adenylyl-L-tyrosine phosphorylase
MKPAFEDLKKACPGVTEAFIREHLSRLGERYFRGFEEGEICLHLVHLFLLRPDHPVETLFQWRKDGSLDCTVLAFDYPAEFSIIAGILAGSGFNILSGDVFTYSRGGKPTSRSGRGPSDDFRGRRRIIDHFTGNLDISLPFPAWAEEVRCLLDQTIRLLERGEESSVREAKHRVNEMVVKRLSHLQRESPPVLYPIRIELDSRHGAYTRMKVVSEDTPAFLYALANALALHKISIEHVRIRTVRGRVEDEIHLVSAKGSAIRGKETLDRIRFSILLTKQFTYFLGKTPDPYTALSRFESLLEDLLRLPSRGKWLEMIENPHTFQDLARLLGASDFLWEDFIRVQYETLLPVLQPRLKEGVSFSRPEETFQERLEKVLEGAGSFEEQRRRFNGFKDQEIFLIDLDQILSPGMDFHLFSEKLTHLAEKVVTAAVKLVFDHLAKRFGTPRTVAGLKTDFAVLGLGKLGGAALGYASDVELLFVYSDHGRTDGAEVIGNAEFFEKLVKEVNLFIQAKREGIFHVDLRLRPYGDSGPLACSLENFCRYYGPGGGAYDYERLALVRLRAIGGDGGLGARLERLRDELVYASGELDLKEIRRVREKQFQAMREKGRLNAKFSPGGLVDLEYGVQILQVTHGRRVMELRTPRIHEALEALARVGVISMEEGLGLIHAYIFFRRLINGMRMLRGSARDLFLPHPESPEYAHLARRMGYERAVGLGPDLQLRIDFETSSALVRTFVEKHFGRDSLPDPSTGGVADVILSDAVPAALGDKILSLLGFMDTKRACVNLRRLAGAGSQRRTFARLAVLACDILMTQPDPDMALNNWERFIHSLPSPESHYKTLMHQPMRLEMLLSLFAGSQFLSDTLIRNPGFLDWVLIPDLLNRIRTREEMEEELRKASATCRSRNEWRNELRLFRRREILRIGTRDLCLRVSTREITTELSFLAEAIVQVTLERVWAALEEEKDPLGPLESLKDRFCIMALGKLGGGELNYSSDIDLLGFCDPPAVEGDLSKGVFLRAMENLRGDLSSYTEEGHLYRVDLRLRPWGNSGELVPTLSGLLKYYRERASLWEIQALLKIRPIAGSLGLGRRLWEKLRPLLTAPRERGVVVNSIEKMRRGAVRRAWGADLKEGIGGLRDVEFLVQGLQMLHASRNPLLVEGNTLTALDLLNQAGLLPEELTGKLKEDYSFLRRLEHLLQIMDDRQIHVLPGEGAEFNALAGRMLLRRGEPARLAEDLADRLNRIHGAYRNYLLEGEWRPGS